MAQLVEHILGKDEVPSSNLGSSSRKPPTVRSGALVFLELLPLDSNCVSSLCDEVQFVYSAQSVSSLLVNLKREYLHFQ